MKKLIVILTLLTGCTSVSHLEHRCSENCNEVIENLQNFEFDSKSIIAKLFKKEVEEENESKK